MGNIKFSYNDVSIVPAIISEIEHRSDCSVLTEEGSLPIFTAPMDTVVGLKNIEEYKKVGIIPIIPRTYALELRMRQFDKGTWIALSLEEFKDFKPRKGKVLIDIANGHMKILYDYIKKAKEICPELIIMAGNIANPETYRIANEAGVDYIRLGIGSGRGCISSSNLGVHYAMGSLIKETAEIKKSIKGNTKIIADGGVRGYADVIKALALGADYVMIGSVFAKALESAAPKTCNSDEWFSLPIETELSDLTDIHREGKAWYGTFNNKKIFLGDITATFYGMASREGQTALFGVKTKTAEGIRVFLNVEYTLESWTTNMTDYLKSAMSYTGKKTLKEFIGEVETIILSPDAIIAKNK
jgi:IMP dehydrogenase/GMP reductase